MTNIHGTERVVSCDENQVHHERDIWVAKPLPDIPVLIIWRNGPCERYALMFEEQKVKLGYALILFITQA